MNKPIVTVGALIENPTGEILIFKTYKWRGKWGVPGGKIDAGETQEEALKREVREETGLEIEDISFAIAQDSIYSPEFHKPNHFILLNYFCRTQGGNVQLSDEAEEYIWVKAKDALQYDLSEPTRVLIERFIQRV